MLAFGLTMLTFSLFHMTTFDLDIDFKTVMMARVYQAMGLAFLFVPINTAAYASLPREKNNAASGLMNLARNIGGSVGISFVTTMLARRAQVHQVRLSENLSAANLKFRSALSSSTNTYLGGGASPGSGPGTATQHAYALLQSKVLSQANMLAYIDNFWVLGVVMACLIPLAFLIKKTKPGGGMAVH
jgi:DHA2 family multidrug resistance protein